jgi:SAM-dependent methyltransferase
MASNYWKDYWSKLHNPESADLQVQVARTRMGNPIAHEPWIQTVEYVKNLLSLKSSDVFLDACGGNGLFASQFETLCKKTVVVDVNAELLSNLKKRSPEINVVNSDLIEFLEISEEKFDKILFYAGIQYFSEHEVLHILNKYMNLLNPGGILLIGDIPDLGSRDSFLANDGRFTRYFDNLREGKETIGTWFSYQWISALSNYLGFESCELHIQPEFQIYSDFRFDVVIRKR